VSLGSCHSGCCAILLVGSAGHDFQRIIGQWPLQGFRLIPRRAHPNVAFLLGCQDHRHGLGVDRFNDRVRRRREEAIDIVRSADRFGFGPAITFELSPDATECEGRPVLLERKPDDVFLFGVGVRLRRSSRERNRRRRGEI